MPRRATDTTAEWFFKNPQDPTHRRYEALRAYYVDKCSAEEVAARFGYALNSIFSLTQKFTGLLKIADPSRSFFVSARRGRKRKEESGELDKLIIELRKKYLSVPDIKAILDSLKYDVSEKYVFTIINKEGFSRLPRRSREERSETFSAVTLEAPPSELLSYEPESFQTPNTIGLLCLIPYIQKYGLDKLIDNSSYPETKSIARLNSILSFIALKLSNVRRYTADNLWCMDRGLGLFAGLNVLPKAAWFTSYSSRVTRKMNLEFLKILNQCFCERGPWS
jgi:transposase